MPRYRKSEVSFKILSLILLACNWRSVSRTKRNNKVHTIWWTSRTSSTSLLTVSDVSSIQGLLQEGAISASGRSISRGSFEARSWYPLADDCTWPVSLEERVQRCFAPYDSKCKLLNVLTVWEPTRSRKAKAKAKGKGKRLAQSRKPLFKRQASSQHIVLGYVM